MLDSVKSACYDTENVENTNRLSKISQVLQQIDILFSGIAGFELMISKRKRKDFLAEIIQGQSKKVQWDEHDAVIPESSISTPLKNV